MYCGGAQWDDSCRWGWNVSYFRLVNVKLKNPAAHAAGFFNGVGSFYLGNVRRMEKLLGQFVDEPILH